MQSPIRDQIRMNDRWKVSRQSKSSASVFVPGPWSEKRVTLAPGAGESWTSARVGAQEVEYDRKTGKYLVGKTYTPGEWNQIDVSGGSTEGARLEGSHPLLFTSLEGTRASDGTLLLRVRLTDAATETISQPTATRMAGLLSILVTVTAPDGYQAASFEVTLGRKTRDLSVAMPLPNGLSGLYRLKASLCANEVVLDNIRTDIRL